MTPYEDADLAALALNRGVLGREQLQAAARAARGAPPRSGALARALVSAGALDATGVQLLLAELERHTRPCACGQAVCALPGPDARRVACPACGRAIDVAPLPAPATTVPHGRTRIDPPSDRPGHAAAPPVAPRRSGQVPAAGPPTARLPEHERGLDSDRGRNQQARPSGRVGPVGLHETAALPPESGPPTRALPGSDRGGGGAPPGARQDLGPGSRVGSYVVEKEISRGAMGVVLRARHLEVEGRVVAIKVMQQDLEGADEHVRRFRREGEVLARLDHPNIVRVYDAALTADGRPYLAMDFVEGRTLEHVAAEGAQPVARCLALLEPVARAVEYMNARGILHRDLKLGNVLLDERDRPVIADFGLARVSDARTRLTQEGDMLGTPLYMSPEMITGAAPIDARTDVYALGVMFFRLLTGSYPFYAQSSVELFEKVLHAPVHFPDGTGDDTRAVIETALARDATRRYPTAGALADELLALIKGRSVKARPRTRGERLREELFATPARTLLLVAPVVALVLALGTWVGARVLQARRREAAVRDQRAALAGERAAIEEALVEDAPTPATTADVLARAVDVEARLRDVGADDDLTALEGERAAVERLARLGRALDLQRAAEADGALEPDEARAVVAAFDAAPDELALATAPEPGVPASRRAPAFADEVRLRRAEAHLAAGLLDGALGHAEPLASGDGLLAARARELRAWAALRLGRPLEPPTSRDGELRVALARAAGEGDLAAARAALAEARAALKRLEVDSPERALLVAQAAAAGLRLDPPASDDLARTSRRLDALALARAVSDPPIAVAGRAPRRDEGAPAPPTPGVAGAAPTPGPGTAGRASLVEGEVLLELGWSDSAAEAFEAAARRLGSDASPAVGVATLGARRASTSPRTACALGLARARADLLDLEPARDAARRAVACARLDAPVDVLVAALLLVVEVEGAAGDDAAARAALDEATQLVERAGDGKLADAAAPSLHAHEDRLRRWSGQGGGAVQVDRAADLLARGEAQLVRSLPVWVKHDEKERPKVADAPDPARHLARARRALRLALGLDDAVAPRACALLARVALAEGKQDEARALAERAMSGTTPPWQARLARGLVRAASRAPGAAASEGAREDLLGALEEVHADRSLRALERLQREVETAGLAEAALKAADDREGLLRLRDRASALFEEGRLPAPLRARWHAALGESALAAGRDDLITASRERDRLTTEDAREQQRLYSATGDIRAGTSLDDRSAQESAMQELLRRGPAEASYYEQAYFFHSQMRTGSYDLFALMFELRPVALIVRANSQRDLNRRDEGGAMVRLANDHVPHAIDNDAKLEDLEVPRDEDVRWAGVTVWGLELGIPLGRDRHLRALRAAERLARRRPTLLAGHVALAHERLELGDAAGALEAIDVALHFPLPFEDRWKNDSAYLHLQAAIAGGHLRRWPAAEASLRLAVQQGMNFAPRVADDRRLCDDRRLAGSQPEAIKQLIVEIKGRDAARERRLKRE